MSAEPVTIKFVVDGEIVQQKVTEVAAWNLMMDLLEIFELPMPVRQLDRADRLKVLVE